MEITLYEKQDLGCMELLYGMDDNLVDSIRVRIKEKANKGDTVLELCQRPMPMGEEVDERLDLWTEGEQLLFLFLSYYTMVLISG